jgi:uncharacterized protein YjiK
LPGRLSEISGLARLPTGELLAHNDERARVSVLDPKTGALLRSFDLQGGPRDDFEGIATADGILYEMTSAGRVYVSRVGKADETVPYSVVETGLGRFCELEGLAWDPGRRALIIPCKIPVAAELKGQLTLFIVPTEGGAAPTRLNVPLDGLARHTGRREIEPTAVELDQRTGHLLVLSSGPVLVAEVDQEGRIVDAAELVRKRHPRPEGIAVLPDGLAISDEDNPGTITLYACRR